MYFVIESSIILSTIIVILLIPKLSAMEQYYSDEWTMKCCPQNHSLTQTGCIFDNATRIKLPVYKTDHITVDESIKINLTNYKTEMKCVYYDKDHFLVQWRFNQFKPHEAYFLQNDGRLWVTKLNKSFSNRHFCIEYHKDLGIIALVCFPGFQELKEVDVVSRTINVIGTTISLPFLLATFIIQALLPERNLYTKCTMCYVFTLFWGYLTPISWYIYLHFGKASRFKCKIIATLIMFFYLASFLWINAIAVDIWLTFSGKKTQVNNEKKSFLRYSVYAWGIPSLLTILIIVMDNIAADTKWYNPFANDGFKGGITELLYCYGPMGIALLINIGLFASTACKIIKTRKETAMLRTSGNQTHNTDTKAAGRFKLYVKLMFVMGINWSVEVIEWVLEWYFTPYPFPWYITDACNAILGVFIFFMFVFNKNTWTQLKKRCKKNQPTQGNAKNVNTQNTKKNVCV